MADGKSRAQRRREERNAEDGGGRRWLWWALAAAGLALVIVSFADAMGAFKSTAYTAVPHGSHDHYVPDRCGDDAPRTREFPMRPPREGERITCDGRFANAE